MMHGQEAGAVAKNIIRRGLFIVFEGLDRSGKSTQSAKLAKYLNEEL
jgi:signal recognition particle GTPase